MSRLLPGGVISGLPAWRALNERRGRGTPSPPRRRPPLVLPHPDPRPPPQQVRAHLAHCRRLVRAPGE